MGKYLIDETTLNSMSSAIKTLTKTSSSITPLEMIEKIQGVSIPENRNVEISSDAGVFYYQTFNNGALTWESVDFGTEINYSLTTKTIPLAKNGLVIGWGYMDHMGSSDKESIEPFLEYSENGLQYGAWFIENDGEYIMCLGVPQ